MNTNCWTIGVTSDVIRNSSVVPFLLSYPICLGLLFISYPVITGGANKNKYFCIKDFLAPRRGNNREMTCMWIRIFKREATGYHLMECWLIIGELPLAFLRFRFGVEIKSSTFRNSPTFVLLISSTIASIVIVIFMSLTWMCLLYSSGCGARP